MWVVQMAKSGLSLEVDCGELGGRILTALRAERWRGRAEAALRTPSKTTGARRSLPALVSPPCAGPLFLALKP